jgi:response regulator of citrate/malate metabolism
MVKNKMAQETQKETGNKGVGRRFLVKEQRLQQLLEIFKSHEGKELEVKEIAEHMGMDPKKTRKYLRMLRAQMPNEIFFIKTSQSLVYVYKPTPETIQKLQNAVKEKEEKKRKKVEKVYKTPEGIEAKTYDEIEKEIELLEEPKP